MRPMSTFSAFISSTILSALSIALPQLSMAQQANNSASKAITASTASVKPSIANDPDVLAAQRLFSVWLEGQLAYRGLPGVAVGVVSDQQLVWSKGFGFADVKALLPMTSDTKFRIASHSKLFNAIAIMQLREEGKLGLDDPVKKHLLWFNAKPAGDDDGVITIEQLLTHSSGLPREAGDHWTSHQFPTSAELKQLFANRQAAFPPATRLKYSNLAVAVAGMLVEEVSGMSWSDYVAKNIFQPLGMAASSVDQNANGLAMPYGRRMPDGTRDIFKFVDARGMAAATGVTSNVADLAKFVSAQFRRGSRGGAQILSSGSLREMHRVRSVEENWMYGYGLGFGISRIRDRTWVGHAGGYPGYTTRTFIQLDDKVGVIVLTNSQDAEPDAIAQQLIATVGQAVAKASAADATGTVGTGGRSTKPTPVAWDPEWTRFAGLYRGRFGDQSVVALNKRLVVINPAAANLDNQIQLEPLGGGRFRFMTPTGGGVIGETVYFVETPAMPMRMVTGDNWVDRIEK
jgi:D-alanyl-D-alanine carboxypeptidase